MRIGLAAYRCSRISEWTGKSSPGWSLTDARTEELQALTWSLVFTTQLGTQRNTEAKREAPNMRRHAAGPSPSMALSQGPERGARTRFHHSESPTAIATSKPPAPANHDAMSTCFFTTVTWLGRSPSALCSWSALSAL